MQFYETVMGKRFFESQLPDLTKALNRVAAAMEQNAATHGSAPQPAKFEPNESCISEMYEQRNPPKLPIEVQHRLQALMDNNDLAEKFETVIEDYDKSFYNKGRDIAEALLAKDVNALMIALTGWGVESLLNLAEYGTPRRVKEEP